MRKSMVETAALAALLLGAALASCQQPAPSRPKTDVMAPELKPDQRAKSKLEEMIEKALHDNPDLRLAEAKLAEAEAELNKARLLVVQKVAVQYQAVEAQKAAVESAGVELKETETRYKTGALSHGEMLAAEQKLIDAKAKLSSLEAELPYLLGQQGEGKFDAKIDLWLERMELSQLSKNADVEYQRRWYLDVIGRLPTAEEMAAALPKPAIQGPTADRIRAALDKPFTYECKGKSVRDVLQDMNKAFQETNPGLLIKDNTQLEDQGPALSAHFDKMPFGAALEWVEDSMNATGVGDFDVVIRDYGIAVVAHERVPPGAPLLRDYLKRPKAEDKASPSKPVEGQVKYIGEDNRIHINFGKKDGLVKGDTLKVFHQDEKNGRSVLLTTIRVVLVDDDESLATLMVAPEQPIRAGDRVQRVEASNEPNK